MVFDVGDMRECVDEAHGAEEIAELELALDGPAIFDELPIISELLEMVAGLRCRVGGNVAFARLATSFCKLANDGSPSQASVSATLRRA
jgi:hypothetical protein